MLCSDDAHPDEIINGYIDKMVKRALDKGVSLKNSYKAAFFNPILHYKLKNVGMLQKGNPADFIVVDNVKNFKILKTYINGQIVFDVTPRFKASLNTKSINNFFSKEISKDDIQVVSKGKKLKVIEAFDGELITDSFFVNTNIGYVNSDTKNDILKILVLNRYTKNSKPVVGFINGFNFKKAAIASSITHDSHNIVAVGVDDNDIVNAVNKLIELKGGIVLADGNDIEFLKLDLAGLMSSDSPDIVIEQYKKINEKAKGLGTYLRAPFMTLSFMPLLVIPKLKIGDKGLFDVTKFSLTNLFEE